MSQLKNQNLMSKIFKLLVKLVLASVAVLAFVVVAIPLPIFSSFQGSEIQLEIKNLAGSEVPTQIKLKDLPGDWDTLCIISGGILDVDVSIKGLILTYVNSSMLLNDNWGLVTFNGWVPKDILLGSYSDYNVLSADSEYSTSIEPALCAKKETGAINITQSAVFMTK